jgi:hypothetical protein
LLRFTKRRVIAMAADGISGIRAIEAEGSHYDVGKTLGREFGEQIEGLFDKYAFFHDVLDPFRQKNPDLFTHMTESQRRLYPRSFRMLEGMADGVGHHLSDLVLYNTRGEVRALTTRVNENKNPVLAEGTPIFDVGSAKSIGKGCSDLVCGHLLGHNEDGVPAELKSSAYVKLIVDGKKVNAVVYAGALVGNAATFLYPGDKMISVSVEDIWGVGSGPLKPGVDYGGRQFAASELIWAKDIDEAVEVLVPKNRLAGFYYTVSSSDGEVKGVEVGPFTHETVDIGGSGKPYVHTNRHLHIEDPEYAHPSSKPREDRFKKLLAAGVPGTEEEVVRMMFDRGNTEDDGIYQICRTNPKAEGSLGLHHLWTMVTDMQGRNTNIYMLNDDKKTPVLTGSINHNHYLG